MKFRTETEPEAIAEHLAERAEEFSAVRGDPREHIRMLDGDSTMLRLCVKDGLTAGDRLDFSATISKTKDGYTLIDGEIMPASDGQGRALGVFYGFLVSFAARLTVLALLYGAILGISFLCGGRGFLLPAIPSVLLAIVWAVRAIRVRCTLRRRISDFFCTCFACTDLQM